ncbi:MAG: hypothetical protein WCO23_02670 [bacterium]
MPPLPSWDIFIGLSLLVGIGYGFILRRDKAITFLCSVYIGMVIAATFSKDLYNFFQGDAVIANQIWIRSNTPLSTISIVLFLAAIVLVSGAISFSNSHKSEISPIEVIVYSALSIALIITSVIGFLPPETQKHCLEVSNIARIMIEFKSALVIAGPAALIILNFRRK